MAKKRRYADHYTKRAKKGGYAARSVFKLEEIDNKHKLFKPGQRIIDLGCAPGSWLKYAAKAVGEKGKVIGLDLQPATINIGNNCQWLVGDINQLKAELIKNQKRSFALILSDMAPNTSGMKDVDHYRSIELAEQALELCQSLLIAGGHLLVKVFQGSDFDQYRAKVRSHFKKVILEKPDSSRRDSREIFILAKSFTLPL